MVLTRDKLLHVIKYEKETGIFTWISGRSGVKKGSIAGSKTAYGYIQIRVLGKFYLAHRLAWLYIYGEWPKNEIDHINGIGSDNRLDNLREATRSENAMNRRIHKNNTSGVKGVRKRPNGNYQARVQIKDKVYCKSFSSLDEAKEFAEKYRSIIHGEFSNN